MQFDDNLLIGPVIPGGIPIAGLQAGNDATGPSPQMRGIGPLGRIYSYNVIPLTLQTNNIAAAQTTAGAGNLTLTAGTGITANTNYTGPTRYQLDCPRGIAIASTGNLSAVNFTVNGWDIYDQPMTQTLAGPNNNTVTTTKAFYQITSIAVSAAVGTNVTVGTSDLFGIPVAVADVGYLIKTAWNSTLADDAGTFTAADTTSPATVSTGDVRGTYRPSANASNGTRRLVLHIHVTGAQASPNATRASALGVPQV